jgi:hypothetical protein
MQRQIRRGALVIGLCGLAALAVPAASSANTTITLPLKGYTVTVAPSAISGGATTTMTAVIKDQMLLVPVNNVQLLVPAGLTVTSASLPAGKPAPVVTTCQSTLPCVKMTGLNLAPGKSVTLTMSVHAPPACSSATPTWNATAQATGLIGLILHLLGINNLPLDSAHSSLATTVNDSCSVSFTQEPNNVIVGQPITGSSYDTTGPPVVATVTDASGVQMAGISVTAALVSNPSSATLGGTKAQTTGAGGAATFADLTVNLSGTGYTMSATAATTGSPSATSTPFDAQNAAAACSGASCSTTAGNTQGTAQITATGPNGTSGTLTESVNVPTEPPLSCAGYTSADPNTYDFLTTNSALNKVVTITIKQPIGTFPTFDPTDTDFPFGDGDGDYDDVLVTQKICFEAPYSFTVSGGGSATPTTLPDGSPGFIGLLPNCNDPNSGPCHDRAHDSAPADPSSPILYDIVLVANIPAAPGDPRMN